MPWIVRSYFFPSLNYFGFFPWASFLAFGLAMGSMLRVIKQEDMGRAMEWSLAVGVGLVVLSRYLTSLPYSIYAKSDYWLNSPALVMVKLGVVLAIMSVAYLWVNLGVLAKWSLFRQLGTTSLLVYWVHIEIVYGRWFGIWKQALSVSNVLIFTTILLVLMTLLSIFRTRIKSVGSFFRPSPVQQTRPASGD